MIGYKVIDCEVIIHDYADTVTKEKLKKSDFIA